MPLSGAFRPFRPLPTATWLGLAVLLAAFLLLGRPAVAAAADNFETALQSALDAARAGQRAEARLALVELTRRWPARPEPWMNLAVLALQDQDPPQARAHLEAALRTSAAHGLAYERLQQLNAQLAREAYARALPGLAAASAPLTLPWTPAVTDLATPPFPSPSPSPATTSVAAPVPSGGGGSPAADTPLASTPTPSTWRWSATWLVLALLGAGGAAWAQQQASRNAARSEATPATPVSAGGPEARLIEVYRLIGRARLPEALQAAETLARELPQFALAQLVYGDLLLAQAGALAGPEDSRLRAPQAQALRQEAVQRLQALRDTPPPGSWPSQVLQLAPGVRHLVAVDVSRSRVYVLENGQAGPRLLAQHYAAIGSQGAGKRTEGDQRTPLGVYTITSRLEGQSLGDFYGAGALPLNYPNDLDRHLGRTGANIWLHGTPSAQYARAPQSTNGCIVLANDDLARWLHELAPRLTPVVVAERLDWVAPRSQVAERQAALGLVETWRRARVAGDGAALLALYAQHFDNGEHGYDAWRAQLDNELQATRGRERELVELSVLAWSQPHEVRVITFTERLRGAAAGLTRRQYWSREGGQWRIFSEGVLS